MSNNNPPPKNHPWRKPILKRRTCATEGCDRVAVEGDKHCGVCSGLFMSKENEEKHAPPTYDRSLNHYSKGNRRY